jgi:hypothetical protein
MLNKIYVLAILGLGIWGRAAAQCPRGDLNNDCRIDLADVLILGQSWLNTGQTDADLNRDGLVDGADLALMADEWQETGCPVVINELLAHSHAEAPDWIELHNVSSVPVNVGGWLLSDEKNDPGKFQIAPGTVIGPFGYLVFYENIDFGNPLNPGTRSPFAMSENGETLYLSSGADATFPGLVIKQPFGASETAYSFGRYRKSTGTYDFATMSEPTPGWANAYPQVGPVVINEIMYHPDGDSDAEYIELLNISSGPVILFDFIAMEPWRLSVDSGIDFWFPADSPMTLDKGEYVVLVKSVAAAGRYGIPPGVKVLPWDSGKLANQGATVELLKPGDVDEVGTRYWIEVDRIHFGDGSHPAEFSDELDPWPPDADGSGASLSRSFSRRYGNDPNNWQAAIPTPGAAND